MPLTATFANAGAAGWAHTEFIYWNNETWYRERKKEKDVIWLFMESNCSDLIRELYIGEREKQLVTPEGKVKRRLPWSRIPVPRTSTNSLSIRSNVRPTSSSGVSLVASCSSYRYRRTVVSPCGSSRLVTRNPCPCRRWMPVCYAEVLHAPFREEETRDNVLAVRDRWHWEPG